MTDVDEREKGEEAEVVLAVFPWVVLRAWWWCGNALVEVVLVVFPRVVLGILLLEKDWKRRPLSISLIPHQSDI